MMASELRLLTVTWIYIDVRLAVIGVKRLEDGGPQQGVNTLVHTS